MMVNLNDDPKVSNQFMIINSSPRRQLDRSDVEEEEEEEEKDRADLTLSITNHQTLQEKMLKPT